MLKALYVIMDIEAKIIGGGRSGSGESEISEISDSPAGLIVIVEAYTKGKATQRQKITFSSHRGYRVLDEGDLMRYEKCETFHQPYCLYQIIKGGWSNGEITEPDILNVSKATSVREWFIATTNMSINVLSDCKPTLENV